MTPEQPSDMSENTSEPHAGHGHATLDLEHFVPYRLSVLSNRVSQTISGIYHQRFGLAVTEWRTMAVLGRYPDLSAGEVAERTAMDKVAVSRALARLVAAGRVDRASHDDDKRRSVLRPVSYTHLTLPTRRRV